MAIRVGGEVRYASRGLPEGYDPRKLYEYRLDTLAKNSSGLESFLYKVMPIDIVKSLAFAIDPTAPFKVSPSTITIANRTRYRRSDSVLNQRRSKKVRYLETFSQTVNYGGISFCWSPYYNNDSFTFPLGDVQINTQDVLQDRVKDTTKRTRLFGSEQGTLELFKGDLISPPRTITRKLIQTSTYNGTFTNEPLCGERGGTLERYSGSTETFTETISPTGATLSSDVYQQLRDGEIALCKALCQKHAPALISNITPLGRRDYSMFRNLVELRDVERSIVSLQKTCLDLGKVYRSLRYSPKLRKVIFSLKGAATNVPTEYVSYHFGWKQLWNDLNDLLKLPEKQAKRVNFLIARSGKPTTLRASKKLLSGTAGVSGFVYNTSEYEFPVQDPHTSSRIERTSEVRLVVNCTWDFPPVNSVEFKRRVFRQLTGIEPRVTDIYNLIPWTWLVDWFTGLGNYIEAIDNINHDPSLFNWGMISCRTTGSLVTDIVSGSHMDREVRINNTGGITTHFDVQNNHQSRYDFECQTRSDLATILDVKLTSVPSTLSTYQMSILGALITQRARFRI
jgi:hypothetical protein